MAEDDDDKGLFRKAMGNVRRLRSERVQPYRPRPRPRLSPLPVEPSNGFAFSDPLEAAADTPFLSFQRPGLQPRTWKQLVRGELAVEGNVDLHGLRLDEARLLLGQLLDEAVAEGLRCLRIIHGKGIGSTGGRGIIKAHVGHWLEQHPGVLAFCSCPPRQGGEGALFVLLRRQR